MLSELAQSGRVLAELLRILLPEFMANAYLVYSKHVLEKKMTFCSLTG